MYAAYLLCLLPIAVGAVLWAVRREVVWFEWLLSAALALITAALFNVIAVAGMTHDVQTLSGQLASTTYYPEWVEKYKVAIYKTEHYTTTERGSDGKTRTVRKSREVFSHYETRYRTHPERWACVDTFQREFDISHFRHEEIVEKFGKNRQRRNYSKPGFYSGDPDVYTAVNETRYIFPVTMIVSWENKVKASPSLFSYRAVPESAPVFAYPANANCWQSNRVLGSAANDINITEWDRMNSRLGPVKKVNVIIVGFDGDGNDSSLAQMQEAKWIGGKKNDLVLCYGPGWSYVFGWTESDIVKQNLQTILLNNRVETALIEKIESEIKENYVIKDWSKFDYLTVEPPGWSYWVLLLVMALTQGGVWAWAIANEEDKTGGDTSIGWKQWIEQIDSRLRAVFGERK